MLEDLEGDLQGVASKADPLAKVSITRFRRRSLPDTDQPARTGWPYSTYMNVAPDGAPPLSVLPPPPEDMRAALPEGWRDHWCIEEALIAGSDGTQTRLRPGSEIQQQDHGGPVVMAQSLPWHTVETWIRAPQAGPGLLDRCPARLSITVAAEVDAGNTRDADRALRLSVGACLHWLAARPDLTLWSQPPHGPRLRLLGGVPTLQRISRSSLAGGRFRAEARLRLDTEMQLMLAIPSPPEGRGAIRQLKVTLNRSGGHVADEDFALGRLGEQ